MAATTNKQQLSTLISADARKLLDALHHAREKEIDQECSLAAYVEYMIRQTAKQKGITIGAEAKTGKRAGK